MTPTMAGIRAATAEPKISSASRTTIGSEMSSARLRSSEVIGLAGQRDQHLGVAAVVAHQPRLGRGLVVGHHRSDRVRGDVGHDLLDGCPERRVVGGEIAVLGRVDRDDVDALVAEGLALGVELACGLRRRVVEPALGQRVEDTGAEGTGPQGEQHPDEQDGEGPAAHECSPTIDHDGSSRSA